MTIDKKNLYSFCFFLFLVLILIFTASKNFSSKIGNSFYSSLIYEKSDPCFFELSFADQNVLSFYKENNQWFVLSKKTFPADNNLVDGLINTLKDICKKESINAGVLTVEPFSLGKVYFQQICDFDGSSASAIVEILMDRVPACRTSILDVFNK